MKNRKKKTIIYYNYILFVSIRKVINTNIFVYIKKKSILKQFGKFDYRIANNYYDSL